MSGKAPLLLVSAAAMALAAACPPSSWAQVSRKADGFTLTHGANTLRASLLSAPPVYAPGGPVCFVEDWSGDEALLTKAEQAAAEQGAVLVRVTCVHHDSARAKLLTRHGYSVASEWYTASLPLAGTPTPHGIRPLTAADVPRVLELGEQKRREYAVYSPVFWRMSPLPRQTFAPYMQAQVTDSHTIALAHETDGKVDGFVLANARGGIDDYSVAAPSLWPTVGADLLGAAGEAAQKKGIKSLRVVCAAGDIPKRTMLAAQGFTLATDWYVKPLARH